MYGLSKRWGMISAIGQGVLFSLALVGMTRFVCWQLGGSLSESVAGNLFLCSSVISGALAAFLYSRYSASS